MQQNKLESIWASGIPQYIDPKDRLEPSELLKMCIHFTLTDILKDKNYEVLKIQDEVTAFPNLILKKECQIYAVAVVPCIYPYFMVKNDKLRIEYAKTAKANKQLAVLCPIPVRSIDEARAQRSIYLKGDLFAFANIEQKILTDDAAQEITPEQLDFYF